MQGVYLINPDKYDRYFSEEEIKSIAAQIQRKPFIFTDNSFGLNLNPELSVGVVTQTGYAHDSSTNLQGIAMIYELTDEFVNELKKLEQFIMKTEDDPQSLKLEIEPNILGIVDNVEDENYITDCKLVNIMLRIRRIEEE